MKTTSVIVKLTKNHHVVKNDVTPIEALILARDHNVNSQGDPIEVVAGTEKDVAVLNGKPWGPDAEIARLRRIYPGSKVDVLDKIRELPTTFADAIEKGKGVSLTPSEGKPTPGVVATAQIKL